MPNPTPALATDNIRSGNLAELYLNIGGDATVIAADLVPQMTNVSVRFAGSSIAVPVYTEEFDRQAKNGLSGSIDFSSVEELKGTLMQALVNAALSLGNGARGTWIYIRSDRSAFSGNMIVNGLNPNSPVRGAEDAAFSCTIDGSPSFEPDVDAA